MSRRSMGCINKEGGADRSKASAVLFAQGQYMSAGHGRSVVVVVDVEAQAATTSVDVVQVIAPEPVL